MVHARVFGSGAWKICSTPHRSRNVAQSSRNSLHRQGRQLPALRPLGWPRITTSIRIWRRRHLVSTSIGYHRKKPPTQVARAKEIILNQVSSSPHARSHDLLTSLFRIRPLRGSNGMDGSSRPRFHESVSRHPLASHSVPTNSAHVRPMCRAKTACVEGKVRAVQLGL
jgi:hypothetical protein